MKFQYIGPDPGGLADYYGYRFLFDVPVEVDNPSIAAKCARNPIFQIVEEGVSQSEEQIQKKRGRPRKVNDGDESGTEE